MLAFAMMHLFPAFFLLGCVAYVAGTIWVLVVGAAFLARKRNPRTVDIILVITLTVLCLLPIVPYRTYERLPTRFGGLRR